MNTRINRNRRAFTLIEIVVMLGILALLATLVITKTEGIFGDSQQKIAKIFVRDSLKTAIARYQMDLGSFPTTAEGLAVLISAPANATSNWRGPYAETPGGKPPLDPWNEPYQYRCPGNHNKTGYDLFSKGPDKAADTEDDIGNW
jgi:general secretion pathway protein G